MLHPASFAGLFVFAFLFTGLLRYLAPRLRLLDLPVARSAHQQPTPVGGGVSIVLPFLAMVVYLHSQALLPLNLLLALLGSAAIALTGLVDDLVHLNLRWRVPAQCLAAVWSVWWLGGVPPIDFGVVTLDQGWLLAILAVLALLWLLNLYNFMDGIDGLAASELIFVNLMSLILVINSRDNVVLMLSATLLTAGAGFLVWNWPPAKIFMGDVGSGFVGFSLGLLALLSMQEGSLTVWTWLVLLAVFVVDATLTLLRRYLRGEKWYEGHASHAYQHAARIYKSHGKVTISIVLINSLWLAPLAWLTVRYPEAGLYIVLLAMAPLVAVAFKFDAGAPATPALAS